MTKYNGLFFDPTEILKHLPNEYGAEMGEDQQAFLCGLIKEHRPQKIVEVGVAAGGTTSVILNCISMLGLETQFFSLDLSTYFYQDKTKKTGYLAEECKKLLGGELQHILYTGKYAVEYLEEIGKNIDFLILDTVHRMPGELLDFLAFFPYLRQGTVVVVHDIALNHFHYNPDSFATKILFDTVVAEKLYRMDEKNALLNIGAFIIDENTSRYISHIFSALTLTWKYYPRAEELSLYRNFYQQYYTDDNIELFDMAVSMNRKSSEEKTNQKKSIWKKEFIEVYQWIEKMKHKRIYIYGCGFFGKRFYHFLTSCGIKIEGYVISDGYEKNGSKDVYYLSELNLDEDKDVILMGVEVSLHEEICAILSERGIREYVIPPRYMYGYLS